MGRWLWKIGEALVVLGIVVFIAVPSHYENEFATTLYATSPFLFIVLLVAIVVIVVAMTVHAVQERRKKKKETEKAMPYRGTL